MELALEQMEDEGGQMAKMVDEKAAEEMQALASQLNDAISEKQQI